MTSLSFLAPLALLGLLALPALWWLLRATPPQPASTPFPPLRLLARLTNDEETPVKTPWWLMALRLTMITALILAFAGPVWRASEPESLPGDDANALLIVLETDWSSAADWANRIAKTERIINAADRAGRPLGVLAFPQPLPTVSPPGDGPQARALLGNVLPHPVRQDITGLQNAVETLLASPGWRGADLVWLPSGISHGADHEAWVEAITAEHALAYVEPTAPNLAVSLDGGSDGPAVLVNDISEGAALPTRRVAAFDAVGRQLAETAITVPEDGLRERIAFDLPLDVRNDIARIAVVPTLTAADVVLVDDRLERKRVGIVGAERRDEAQPLLSGTTYVERALRPFSDLIVPRSGDTAGEIDAMISDGVSVIILVDVASIVPSTASLLEAWINDGGVLVRFASSSLTRLQDELIPVPLRTVDRQLGGALTWDEPQAIAQFSAGSPFAGLTIPEDVLIERQVLSEPGAALATRTYAELRDSTPLVTGEQRGDGHLILFHVTADTSWSNLPLSGLFVDMLQRLVQLSETGFGGTTTNEGVVENATLSPRATLDGFGVLGAPPTHAESLILTADSSVATLANPPGYYGPSDSQRALNLFTTMPDIAVFDGNSWTQVGAVSIAIETDESISLRTWLLTLVALLALADALAVLALSGGLAGMRRSLRRGATAAVIMGMVGLGGSLALVAPTSANAQDGASNNGELSRLIAAANTTRLAYVLTGENDVDRRSREGMSGLTRILTQRTAFEPGEPFAVDPMRDELAFYPLIYWPLPAAPMAVSDDLIARIDAYMNNGGTILFDTRDEADTFVSASISPQTANLRRLLGALDIPPLEPVPDDHVLTKSFYLLDSFPGRFASGPLWVEALPDDTAGVERPARGGDGVTPIMITGNDFASAWALSAEGRPLYPTSPPDRVQREFAFRTGVNIGMYVMTGNYKADQVHIPALLERLGQ